MRLDSDATANGRSGDSVDRTMAASRTSEVAVGVRLTYSVDDVALMLGISRSAAYECVRRGEIPARRFGRRVVVLRRDLLRLLGDEV